MIIGAQYYRPPNPPHDDWRRDLLLMKQSGLNTVKFWACWSWVNVRDAEFDWADLDELMEHARSIGLTVVINTIIENAPYWLEQQFPNARYVDDRGDAMRLTAAMNTPGGGWPGLCFDNDEVWAAASHFLTQLVQRYDDNDALSVWDVWNEPHLEPASYFPERMYCYCGASVARFVAWLQGKYGTLDALNLAWSRRFSAWDQVQPPRVFEAVPDLIDWREFWFDNLERWLERRVATVRAAGSGKTVMTHVALSGFTGQLATHTLDEFRLARHVDAFGTSSFPTWLMADDHVEHLFNLDTARDASRGIPFWQAELQGGRGRRDGDLSTGQPRPEVVELWMWNALAAGATGIMFWQWRPELLGPESPGYGLCAPDGSPTPRVEAVTRFATIAAHPKLEGRVTIPSAVGLVVSRKSALHAFATDRTMALYRDAVLGAYRMLLDADIDVTFVHEDDLSVRGVPVHIQSIYWPMPAVADHGVMESLARFVENGGVLVAEASPGEYSTTGHRRATVPDDAFGGIFGAHETETTTADVGERIITAWGELPAGWQKERVSVGRGQVIGTFADGAPAIVETISGRGTAVLIASYPSVAYAKSPTAASRTILGQLLRIEAKETAVRWVHQAPGLVTRRAASLDGSELVFAINWTAAPAQLSVPTGSTVLAGTIDGLEVPALSAVLLAVERGRTS
ncbi:MAG: Beta-galactosidase/beta-galactosidase [Microbacteriaceae bacterium]|jgi:beta-galactosidase GanA|nr:Beta-galactosidase/beta-galactosidase [Microbacteriaceae bacterium]